MISMEVDIGNFIDTARINKIQFKSTGIINDSATSFELKSNDGKKLHYCKEVDPNLYISDLMDDDLDTLDYVFADEELNDELNETEDVVFVMCNEI